MALSVCLLLLFYGLGLFSVGPLLALRVLDRIDSVMVKRWPWSSILRPHTARQLVLFAGFLAVLTALWPLLLLFAFAKWLSEKPDA